MKILMVCLGNICRSPIAQGIMENKVKALDLSWFIDSAGTSGWHEGEHPDPRAIQAAKSNHIDISKQKSRKILQNDLDYFDVILTMDSQNYNDVIDMCKNETQKRKVDLLMNFKYQNRNMAVPDPYYNGKFNEVFDLISDAMEEVISHLEMKSKNQVT